MPLERGAKCHWGWGLGRGGGWGLQLALTEALIPSGQSPGGDGGMHA